MSNQSWQPPQNGANNPWASQDPNWRPTQFHEAQGRDPRTPFGQQPKPPPNWEDLTPPERKKPTLWIALAAVAVIAAIAIATLFSGSDPVAQPELSPSAGASSPASEPTPTRTGNFIPFEGNGNGIFEVVSYEWRGDDELHVRLRVEVEEAGEFGFSVFVFANETRVGYEAVDPAAFVASKDKPFEGDFVFLMPKSESTVMLTTPSGRITLNALPIGA